MPIYIPDYNHLLIHKHMLSDHVRTRAFCAAIAGCVNKGIVVIDLGAGTGILALAAARAGARKIWAIERKEIAKVAKKVVDDNGYGQVISVLQSDSREVELNEKADLLVSEFLGVYVFQESMLKDFIDVRDRLLKKGGILIPEAINLWAAPMRRNPIFHDQIERWQAPLEGFNFQELSRLSLNEIYVHRVREDNLSHPGNCLFQMDLYTVKLSDRIEMKTEFVFDKDENIEGICGWFDAQLCEGVTLDTSPTASPTHWLQTVYPLHPRISVNENERLQMSIIIEPCEGYVDFTWSVQVEGREDTTFQRFSTKNNYTLPGTDNTDSGRDMNALLIETQNDF